MTDCMNCARVASETVTLCVFTKNKQDSSKIQERAQSRFQPKSEDIGPENEVGKSRW